MDIIIAGAGTVGFRLAETLSDTHNVTVIDQNADALTLMQESLDILPVHGNAEDPLTYGSLLDKEADLFISVTDSDETNIISCLIADEGIKVKQKIVRLRNAFFARSTIAVKLGITEAVFPLARTADAVRSLLNFPRANSIKRLNQSEFRLVSVRIRPDARERVPYGDIASEKIAIVGIERDKKYFVPKTFEVVEPGDLLYLYGDTDAIRELCKLLETDMPKKIKKIVILGADALGIEIAARLVQPGVDIKVIEKDPQRCAHAAEILKDDVTIINSQYGNDRLIHEEGLENADMFIASSRNDEENIIRCIEAREYGVEKVVAINNDRRYYTLMHKMGMVVVRGPKSTTYYSIIEKIGSSVTVNSRYYCGGAGVALTRTVYPDSALIGKSIKPYDKVPCRCLYIRNGALVPFDEPFSVEVGDLIMAFTTEADEKKVKKWISAL